MSTEIVGRRETTAAEKEAARAAVQPLRDRIAADHLYTATEAADYLNVKPRTVLVWAQRRMIGCVRTGPHAKFVRFKREHLEAFVDAHTLNAKG